MKIVFRLETNRVKCRSSIDTWAACACYSATDQLFMLSALAWLSQQNSTSFTELTLPQLAQRPLSPFTRQDSSVTNVTCYVPDRGSTEICFVHCVHTGSGANPPIYPKSTGVNQSGRVANHYIEEKLYYSANFRNAMLNK